ncbi:MAG: ABC-2 type transport system permease protein [Planctomycetota bacterium]|jgi:ABC-2 type transport system permease protein
MSALIRSTATVFETQVFQLLKSKRLIVCGLLACAPVAIACVLRLFVAPDEDVPVELVAWVLIVQGITPLLSLVFGSAVISEEVSDRTISYLFTRPVPRVSIFMGRWLASLVVTSGLLIGSAAATIGILGTHFECSDPFGVAWSLALTVVFGTAVYSALFASLGALIKHPMIVGLGYIFAFEFLLVTAPLPGSLQHMALQFQLRSFIAGLGVDAWTGGEMLGLKDLVEQSEALTTMALLLVGGLVVGNYVVSRRQYELTA